MLRLFKQHQIRTVSDLSGIWQMNVNHVTGPAYVPSCWEQNPALRTYRGVGTYTKSFTLATEAPIRLVFKGVSHTASVYVDDQLVAEHYNGYTPFDVIVPHLAAGTHELRVTADNRFSEASALHVPNDYYSYGGITRPVALEVLHDVYIARLAFTPSHDASGWHATVAATLTNLTDQQQNGQLSFNLAEITHTVSLSIKAKATTTVTWQADYPTITPWTPEDPQLYALTANWAQGQPVDDLIERIGFRTVRMAGSKLLLNDTAIFLKGFNRHEAFGGFGCAVPLAAMVQDIQTLKDLGANALRTCHYPNDERFLDLCDENGLMVWEENHARGLSLAQMQNPHFDAQAAAGNEAMVTAHYNHPAIIIWGLLNECSDDTEAGAAKYAAQFAQLRALDQSRPLTAATCHHFTARCLALDDIVSTNLYTGWYQDCDTKARLDKELTWIYQETKGDQPVIISEFGASALRGNNDPLGHAKWSEERQADILADNLAVYLNDQRLCGVFVWQFADCRVTEEKWFERRPALNNNKGILDEYRRPKLAYLTVKQAYTTK